MHCSKIGITILKKLKIILTDPVEKIFEKSRKEKLMAIYHNDPPLGGHCGQKNIFKAQHKILLEKHVEGHSYFREKL